MRLAVTISLPWYRVQALAAVAKAAADDRVDAILRTARSEAAKDLDSYRRVAVLAWVIEAAHARERDDFAAHVLREALAQTATIDPMKSRAAALELLLVQATHIGEHDARLVAEALLDVASTLASHPYKKWRKWGVTYVNRTAWILSRNLPPLAVRLLSKRFGTERAAAILARHAASQSISEL